MNVAGEPDHPAGSGTGPRVTDGLYTLGIEMTGIKRGHATGVVVLQGGRIMGGDSFFYYTGSYSCLLYTSPSPRDGLLSRMPSSA